MALLAVVNALAPWGDSAAARGEAALQLGSGLGAIACAVVVAPRVTGMSRWWRLLYAAAVGCWLVGQILWWTADGARVDDGVSAPGVVAYLLAPLFALIAILLLARSSGGVTAPDDGWLGRPAITNVLDGVVAALAFLILAAMGGFGDQSTASLPRSGVPAIEITFAVAEVLIVGAAVAIATIYDPDRPYRANYLWLAGGLVTMAASDRLVEYFWSIGEESGALWGGIGLILGPLMIAFAMFEFPAPAVDDDPSNRRVDLLQLIMPYVGFLGIAVLFAFHVFLYQPLSAIAVCAAVVMVTLVTVRQVVAMRAQRLLTRRLYWALHHDALTGLPNRTLFAQLLDEAARDQRSVLILVDLDDFKDVNDRYGHAAGDELLRAVGERLKRCLSEHDTLARIGGDEFAILTRSVGERLEVVADHLRMALRDPFAVQGSSVRVRASMGVVGPGVGGVAQTSDDLLRQADISMFAGKQHGKDRAVVYQASTGTRADFPIALRDAEGGAPVGFRLVYQPVVALPDGTPVAVEALARWTAPNGMLISPETFVGAAEAAGLGAALDALVLDLACCEVASAGLSVDIHVNVGAARLGSTGFDEHVRRTLERHRIEPGRLVVEITETVPIVDIADAAAHIDGLNEVGVRVALDDFGAGYNSLTYLHMLPVDIVKLDRSLAVGADPPRGLALYNSVMGLCADLGFVVIAEGIETASQASVIQAAGCRLAQGHLFGRPVPIGELAKN